MAAQRRAFSPITGEPTGSLAEELARLQEWAVGHQRLDDTCFTEIKDGQKALERGLSSLTRVIFGVLLALVGWLAIQVWNGQVARVSALERPAAHEAAR